MLTAIAAASDCPASANLDIAWYDAAQQAKNNSVTITCVGDSLTWRQGAFYDGFSNAFEQQFGLADDGYQACSVWSGAVNGFGSTGWTQGTINQDTPPHWSLDGMWLFKQDGGFAGFQMDVKQSIGTVHVLSQPGGAILTVNGVQYDTNVSVPTVMSVPYAVQGNQNLTLSTNGIGSTLFLGVVNDDGTKNVLNKVANGGWGVDEFLRRNWTFDAQLTLLDSNVYMIMLGQNDGVFTNAQWRSQLVSLCDRLLAAAPDARIVLISSYNSGNTALRGFNQQMYSVAMQYGYGYVNLYEFGGNRQFYADNGYLDLDGLHFSVSGGNYVGQFVLNMLQNAVQPTYTISSDLIFEDCEGC